MYPASLWATAPCALMESAAAFSPYYQNGLLWPNSLPGFEKAGPTCLRHQLLSCLATLEYFSSFLSNRSPKTSMPRQDDRPPFYS